MSIQNLPKEVLQPPAREETFDAQISHPDIYIWDSWCHTSPEGTLHLYTLGTSRTVFEEGGIDIQLERDHIPHHHRLFTSEDDGHSWTDQGPVFAPRLGEDKFDSRSIWTGSVIEYEGALLCGYTGIRQTDNDHPFLQNIGLAVSRDGGFSFERLTDEALSDPIRDYHQIRDAGYFLGPKDDLGSKHGEDGCCAMAWRDPGLVVNHNTGDVHAFWSAKSDTNKPQEAVLAHGIIRDPLGAPKVELQQPVRLPDEAEYTQAEVPQIFFHEGSQTYYLMLSTTDKTSELQTDSEIDTAARIYRCNDIADPQWEYLGHVLHKHDKKYPGAIIDVRETSEGIEVDLVAPYNRSNGEDLMHSMSPIQTANIAWPAPNSQLLYEG